MNAGTRQWGLGPQQLQARTLIGPTLGKSLRAKTQWWGFYWARRPQAPLVALASCPNVVVSCFLTYSRVECSKGMESGAFHGELWAPLGAERASFVRVVRFALLPPFDHDLTGCFGGVWHPNRVVEVLAASL